MTDKRKQGQNNRWGHGLAFHPERRKAMSDRARKLAAAWSKPKPDPDQ